MIDSQTKRLTVQMISLPFRPLMPVADGTIAAADRIGFAYYYASPPPGIDGFLCVKSVVARVPYATADARSTKATAVARVPYATAEAKC